METEFEFETDFETEWKALGDEIDALVDSMHALVERVYVRVANGG
jgi:hypothetical protein